MFYRGSQEPRPREHLNPSPGSFLCARAVLCEVVALHAPALLDKETAPSVVSLVCPNRETDEAAGNANLLSVRTRSLYHD